MNNKNKFLMVGFLLIAFIGISIGINGFELIPETEINSNTIYLNQTHDFNGTTYNLTSVEEFENAICIDINELPGTSPCVDGNVSITGYTTLSREKRVDTTEYNRGGSVVAQDILVFNDRNVLVRTYAFVTEYFRVQNGYVDYNSVQLGERISGILNANCINRGECEPLPEVYQPTTRELIDDLTDRITVLETENDLLKSELCRVSRNAYAWCLGVGS